jgi:hypothetical protein
MIEAIHSRPAGILDGGTYFVVGYYESDGDWGIGHLAAAVGSEPPNWDISVQFIVQSKGSWRVALQETPLFDEFMNDSTNPYKTPAGNNNYKKSALVNSFLFPWDKSQQWRYTYGWHGGTNLALDFAPSNTITPSNMWILASASGTVTHVCTDTYQAAIDLSTPYGVTTYRHIDYNSLIAQNVNNKAVSQGQKLAVLYNGTQGSGYFDTSQNYPWPACIQGSSPTCTYIKYNTYCGSGTGTHVHWTLPAKPFIVDGWQVDINGLWTKSGELNKSIGASFNSTNSFPVTITGTTVVGGVTLSYLDGTYKTATSDNNGLYSFTIPSGWTGTVTPFKIGSNYFLFSPINRSYTNVLTDQTSQNYTVTEVTLYSLFLPLILR